MGGAGFPEQVDSGGAMAGVGIGIDLEDANEMSFLTCWLVKAKEELARAMSIEVSFQTLAMKRSLNEFHHKIHTIAMVIP